MKTQKKIQNNAKRNLSWRQLVATTLVFQLLMAQSFMIALPVLTIPSLVASAGAVEGNDTNLSQTGDQNFAVLDQNGEGNQAFVDQINNIVGVVPGADTVIAEAPNSVLGGLGELFESVFPEDPYTELLPNAPGTSVSSDPRPDIVQENPFEGRDLFGDIREIKEDNPIMDFLETLANNVVTLAQEGTLNAADIDQGDSAGRGNVAIVNQDGLSNTASIEQVYGANWGQVEQNGESNVATIKQSLVEGSNLNVAYVKQDSGNDMAEIFQDGSRNFAAILQDDNEEFAGLNTATINQDGFNNIARVTQRGGSNSAEITQLGDMNLAQVLQDGFNNLGTIFQNGMGNEATISQLGSDNVGFISQIGDGNIASITQTGVGHEADISQTGDGNTAHVVQSGPARLDPVVVNQTGGASIFIHY